MADTNTSVTPTTTGQTGATTAPTTTLPATASGLINTLTNSVSPTAPVAGSQGYTPVDANSTGYNATQASSTGYTANPWTVTPEQTASGQLQQVLDPNNPLMQQAATLGNQQANARGLVNSTMGITAADNAMYSAAVPIATSNAATYANAGQANAGALNAAAQFGANAANTATLTNAGATNAAAQFGAGATNSAALANQQATNTASSATAAAANTASLTNAQNATSIANNLANNATSISQTQLQTQSAQAVQLIQSQYQSLIQSNAQATSVVNQVLANIANIQNSTSMGQDAKNVAVAQQLGLLTQGLQSVETVANTNQSAIGSLNLSGIFAGDTVSTVPGSSGQLGTPTNPAPPDASLFPSAPTNGQVVTIAGQNYTYSAPAPATSTSAADPGGWKDSKGNTITPAAPATGGNGTVPVPPITYGPGGFTDARGTFFPSSSNVSGG